MGEISIAPKFNIHETYKKVRILNPYRFNPKILMPTEGLVSYYKMDETSGNQVLDSWGVNHGTNSVSNIGVQGKIGGAISFNNNTVNLGDIDLKTDIAYSLSIWFKTSIRSTGQFICRDSSSRFWQFRIDSSGAVRFLRFSGSISVVASFTTPATYKDGLWHNAIATFSIENGSRIYVDGQLKASDSNLTPNKTGLGANISIGSRFTTEFFNGSLDEASIYANKELTAAEVLIIYNNGDGITI